MMNDLIDSLREYAEWADANEWEVPICLGDDLREAAEYIEKKERAEKIVKNQNPCARDCPDRSADCHGKCERYAEYAAMVAEARKKRALHKADEYTINYTIQHRRK